MVLTEQLRLLVAGCDCSVKELPCAAGIGLGVEVCQEALGNAVSGVWLKPARLRLALGPHLHLKIHYALSAIQLVFSKKIDERFGPRAGSILGCMLDAVVIHNERNLA